VGAQSTVLDTGLILATTALMSQPAKGPAIQYTDTAGFTDHVFALCHLLGFEFAPRIADLADKNLYVPGKAGDWPALSSLIGGSINRKLIEREFDDVVRLAASIQQGTVTASLILRKLSAYPRQNGLAVGLCELGRIERTLFTLKWLLDPALRRRVSAGLNKGEARNSLARAVFFYRLGEIRERSYENQRYRASGLNLVVAAITLWNTVYLERSIAALRQQRKLDPARRASGLESHQPDRRLRMARQQARRKGAIPAVARCKIIQGKTLAKKSVS
jgi:TnpA family transposase